MQRSMLNITCPRCCLHDTLCSDQDVSKDNIKSNFEQSLCLLGSANFQFSALRRKKILVAINKDKIGLADQPVSSAKRLLFGGRLSKYCGIKASRPFKGPRKDLGCASRPAKLSRSGSSRARNKKPFAGSCSKYNNRSKNGRSFRAPNRRQKNRLIHRQLEGNNLRPRHPQYYFRLQNSVALQTNSIYHSSYKSQPSKC